MWYNINDRKEYLIQKIFHENVYNDILLSNETNFKYTRPQQCFNRIHVARVYSPYKLNYTASRVNHPHYSISMQRDR